jgi:twitching motility two-component system response regulator PilG
MSKSIMIVGDDQNCAESLRHALDTNGHEVIVAGNGMNALAMFREKRPHLIILDVNISKVDGYHVSRLIKFDIRFKHIPIIMISGTNNKVQKELGLACGANEYITKPYDKMKLIEIVERHLSDLYKEDF